MSELDIVTSRIF